MSTSTPLKILMLHGYTQSGPLFRSKTRALEKNLTKHIAPTLQLLYPTGPHRLTHADIPSWEPGLSSASDPASNSDATAAADSLDSFAWWRRKGDTEVYTYEGLDDTFAQLAQILRDEGPVAGVVGFSQGGALAMLLASVLESGRADSFAASGGAVPFPPSFLTPTGEPIHPPLKFAVSYSGFAALDGKYAPFYAPKIVTPTLHVLGSLDTVVAERRSLVLAERCENARIAYHPGGHYLPGSKRESVAVLVSFLREALGLEVSSSGAGHSVRGSRAKDDDVSVEDMELPF